MTTVKENSRSNFSAPRVGIWFVRSAAIILFVSATAKLISSFGRSRLLDQPEPVFGFSFRHLLLLAGGIEMAAVIFCFSKRRIYLQSALVAWLATIFAGYRLSLYLAAWHSPCPCLGNLTDLIGLSPKVADSAMEILLLYLLFGGYGLLLFPMRKASARALRLSGAVCIVLTVTGASSVHAQGAVEINGIIDVDAYLLGSPRPDTIPEVHWSFHFTCVLSREAWRIENDASRNGIERMYSDGTNLYDYLKQTGPAPDIYNGHPPLGSPKFEVYSPTNNLAGVNIFPGKVPVGGPGIGLPWLAFCSGNLLKEPNHSIPVPIAIREQPDAFGYRDDVQCFDGNAGLPKTVNLYTSKAKLVESIDDKRLSRFSMRRRAQALIQTNVPDGQLKFHYAASAATNFQGFVLPVAFAFTEFGLDSEGHWHTEVKGSGRVYSIKEAHKPQNVFENEPNLTITDWRFRSDAEPVDAITYKARDMVTAPPTNDASLQKRLSSEEQKMRNLPTPKPVRRWVLIGLMTLLVGLPPILWFNSLRERKEM